MALALAIGGNLLAIAAPWPALASHSVAPAAVGAGRRDVVGSVEQLWKIVTALAERGGARILLDPEIVVTRPPKVPDAQLSVDQALRGMCASLPGIAFRRLYLPPRGPLDSLPPPEVLATAVRTLDTLAHDHLVVEEPSRSRALSVRKEQPLSPTFAAELQARKFATAPIYLLYATEIPAGKVLQARLADLQGQQLSLPIREEDMALAMVQMMQLLQAMPPEQRDPFVVRTGQAGMRLWDATPPPQREEMLQQSLRLMQRFGAPGAAPAPTGKGSSRGGVPPPARGNLTGVWKAAATALAKRCQAVVVIDPSVVATVPPADLDADLPITQALDTLVAPQPGIAWRRLYLSEAQLKHARRAESAAALSTAVRTLEGLACGNLVVEDSATQRATFFVHSTLVSAAELETEKLSPRPVYMLYSTAPDTRGDTLEQRFGHLQRQQMALMLQMDPSQMARSMEQLIQSFDSADAVRRARLMGLPMAAAMMAVWFPQAAKERGGDSR
jgi:hypothetical protein